MNMLRKRLFLFCFCFFLAGCAPTIMTSNPRSVLIGNVNAFQISEAYNMAEAECQKYKRHAVMIPGREPDGLKSFECKD